MRYNHLTRMLREKERKTVIYTHDVIDSVTFFYDHDDDDDDESLSIHSMMTEVSTNKRTRDTVTPKFILRYLVQVISFAT